MSQKEKKVDLENQKRKKVGRPTDYNEEIADLICDRIATHACGLKELCAMYEDMPDDTTIYRWSWRHEEFSRKYVKAKSHQCNLMADQTLVDAKKTTPEEVNCTRLHIDTVKWYTSKIAPKIFGKQALLDETLNKNERLERELKELRDRLYNENKKEY